MENMIDGKFIGITKIFSNDESMTNFISTDKQISTAGWMNAMVKTEGGLDTKYQKQFDNDGEIFEGYINENCD
jgi:hypothetical protein